MPETRRSWSDQEDNLIRELVSELGTRNWSAVSEAMKFTLGVEGRSGKQCRQRWHNHLAPQIKKKPWSERQEQILFESHRRLGNRWTQISKLIEGRYSVNELRTDNAIKNHFYSSIRRSLRRINKILGSKNSTNQMRNIKPAVLSEIFMMNQLQDGPDEQRTNLQAAIIDFSRIRVHKSKSIQNKEKQNLQNVINLLEKYSDKYQLCKKQRKRISDSNLKNFSQNFNEQIEDNQNEDPRTSQKPKNHDVNAQMNNQEHSVEGLAFDVLEDNNSEHSGFKMNLEDSVYDWAKFEDKCEQIKSQLESQNSFKLIKSYKSLLNLEEQYENHQSQKLESLEEHYRNQQKQKEVTIFTASQQSIFSKNEPKRNINNCLSPDSHSDYQFQCNVRSGRRKEPSI